MNWPDDEVTVDKKNWFIDFEQDTQVESPPKTEGEQPKRPRGRPRKVIKSIEKPIHDTSFAEFADSEKDNCKVLFTLIPGVNESSKQSRVKDEVYHALLAHINDDPISFKEAMNSKEKESWRSAIDEELNSLRRNDVWEIVSRPQRGSNGRKPNIIDSRWVFKRKIGQNKNIKYKARLVIRGFKDKNVYDLMETYAPVSRLVLVRCVIAIVNKYKLIARQLDVKTAFLNGTIDEEIYLEILREQVIPPKR